MEDNGTISEQALEIIELTENLDSLRLDLQSSYDEVEDLNSDLRYVEGELESKTEDLYESQQLVDQLLTELQDTKDELTDLKITHGEEFEEDKKLIDAYETALHNIRYELRQLEYMR